MKIIHTADWHLGNVFHRHNRVAEHRHFFGWLRDTIVQQQPDALIVSGDIFDGPNPAAEVQRLFYDFLTHLSVEHPGMSIILIAGNHDSGARLEAGEELLRLHNIFVRGTVWKDAEGETYFERMILPLAPRGSDTAEVVCYALPFLRPADYPAGLSVQDGLRHYLTNLDKRLKKTAFKRLPVVVAAHFYAHGALIQAHEHSERLVVGGQDMVEIDTMGKAYAYVALGHIHRPQAVGNCANVRYAGSPLALSFSERDYKRAVNLVEIDTQGHVETTSLFYTPLCALISLPDRGALDPQEALSRLRSLPDAQPDDDREAYPYVEMNIRLAQPEPELRRRIGEIIEHKAVKFCRITTSTYREQSAQDDTQRPAVENSLHSQAPIDIAKQYYTARYGNEMPEALVERFNIAVNSIDK
ncbi:MAG: exonuclease SbcCD subunit D [Prevotellaceae bacterium]|jgi:exonuclease sbcCD, D subunit|nr:exonuclease SbcCD subunit D [Prevotellaceae bacterium]